MRYYFAGIPLLRFIIIIIFREKKIILENTMFGRIYRVAYGNELQSA